MMESLLNEILDIMASQLKTERENARLVHEIAEERKRASNLEASYKFEKDRAEAAEYGRGVFRSTAKWFAEEAKRIQNTLDNIQKQEADKSTEGTVGERITADPKSFENKFNELRSKYDTQLGENQTLRRVCREFETLVKELETENKATGRGILKKRAANRRRFLKMQTTHEGARRSQLVLPKAELSVNIYLEKPDFQEFLSKISIPPHHPQFHRLLPIQDGGVALNEYLPPILIDSRCSANFMYFRDRLIWPRSMNYALVFSPYGTIGTSSSVWERSTEASSMHGVVRELFYSKDGLVYYAGSFKCIKTSKWFPEGISLPRNVSAERIAELALMHHRSPDLYKERVTRAFADGTMKAECMVLECMGFNRYLYSALLEEYSSDRGLKRKRGYEDKESHKKQRNDNVVSRKGH
ncbi:hypothetical protein BDZ94DRAFT_1258179 [Collybia nuda]|uniref:Uncharacterized protein n=1 Tax=Collybia nuda TaxID=64659 RepID=A0A9P5Y6L8_9AGAR|nr:hypothetical protein BDZ94DRAFT_1258179 [Collybia nuda]